MKCFLEYIREKRNTSLSGQIIRTIMILLLGIALGVLSKFLDSTAGNALPPILEYLDVRNFLGRFAIWMLLGLCIAVYSPSPACAAISVFAFFSGMVASYYAYSKWIAGFFLKAMYSSGLDLQWFHRCWHGSAGTRKEKKKFRWGFQPHYCFG